VFGEIGLSGEVRRVSQPDLRLKEAVKLGFTQAIMPEIDKSRKPAAENRQTGGAFAVISAGTEGQTRLAFHVERLFPISYGILTFNIKYSNISVIL
jgi:hypothetical protein